MEGKAGDVVRGLFSKGARPEAESPPPDQDEATEDLGACAGITKPKWVTALTVRHAGKPWESFQFKDLDVRSEFEPTRFVLGFSDAHDRYKVVVSGRGLERIYNLCIQGRLEWIRASERDFAKDGEPIILKVEVVKVEEKRG